MARNNKILVPEVREELDLLRTRVMKAQGYNMNKDDFGNLKYEIANEIGIPLTKDDNGNLTAKQAGKIGGPIGGPIGGNMVKELIRMAQEQMIKK